MLAYVFDERKKLVLKETPAPTAKSNSAIIKVNACSICGTDFRTFIQGSAQIDPPRIIGHEVVGNIVEIGEEINGFSQGDRVAVAPAIGCGDCFSCLTGHPNMCDNLQTIGFQFDGGFAEFMEIPGIAFERGNVNKLSASIEDEEAALAEPIACILNAQEFLEIKDDDYVAVWGAGFIGCLHAELALKSGASKVMMIEVSPQRAEKARALLPEVIMLNPSETDISGEIREITGGRGINVGITACSVGKAQAEAQRVAAKRGRISLFGGLAGEATGFIDSNAIHYKELSVYGVHASTPDQNRRALDLITKGDLKVKKYITNVYALKDIEKAFTEIKNGHVLKAIIEP